VRKLLKESVSEHIFQIERAVDVGHDVFEDPALITKLFDIKLIFLDNSD